MTRYALVAASALRLFSALVWLWQRETASRSEPTPPMGLSLAAAPSVTPAASAPAVRYPVPIPAEASSSAEPFDVDTALADLSCDSYSARTCGARGRPGAHRPHASRARRCRAFGVRHLRRALWRRRAPVRAAAGGAARGRRDRRGQRAGAEPGMQMSVNGPVASPSTEQLSLSGLWTRSPRADLIHIRHGRRCRPLCRRGT